MNDSGSEDNAEGAPRRDLIKGAAGGVMPSSVHITGQAATPEYTPAGVEQLLAIEAIRYRKARYAYCVDNKDWEGFAANFTEDASWDIRGSMDPRNPVTGKWMGISEFDEQFLKKLVADAADWPVVGPHNIVKAARAFSEISTSAHKLFTPMIDILSDKDARAIWPFEDESYSPPPRAIKYLNGVGYYHETYSKVGTEWLIKSTIVKRTFLVIR